MTRAPSGGSAAAITTAAVSNDLGTSVAEIAGLSPAELRLQLDSEMIDCVRQDGGHHSYFSRPPLRPFSLCFEDASQEEDYRYFYFLYSNWQFEIEASVYSRKKN